MQGQSWAAVGDEANWERGLENGIWGLVQKLENYWRVILLKGVYV